jgi:TolB-like protein/class 3 adenylate cyclase
LAAIVSADVVGYSLLMGRDDSATLAGLKAHRQELIDSKIAEYRGRIVKTTGDGLLLEFPSVVDAVRCGVDIQRGMAERNAGVPPEQRIEFRIGINIGDIIIDGDDIFGDGVNVAARLQTLAEPGGICVSRVVRDQVLDKLSFAFEDLGAQEVKNIARPVEVYRVELGSEPLQTPRPGRWVWQRWFPSASWRPRWALLVTAVAVVIAAGYFSVDRFVLPKRFTSVEATPSAPAGTPVQGAISSKSVAVLPFVDMSEKKDQEYFADGLSEELMGMLSKVAELKVPARTSSFYFKGKQTTIADIAKALGVSHVLEGSVRKSGNTLRVSAQLIRVDNGYQVWSETYDRNLDDIFKVQDEIAGAVVKALKVSLLEADLPKAAPATNQEAYALYLQARTLHYRGTQADARKGISYLQQALKLDPKYAPAWFGLADSLVYVYGMFGGSYQEIHAQARAAAETALRLDPKLSDAHLAMGRILGELEWDWPAADVELKRTLELDPNNVLALEVASGYALIGDRFDEALKLIQNAAARDAVGWGVYAGIGDVQNRMGRLAEAEAAYRKSAELNPTAAGTHFSLGIILLARGQPAAALAAMEQETDEAIRQNGLVLAFDALGRQADADRALAALEASYADNLAVGIASVYACRRQLDRAFEWLDRAYRQRDGQLPFIKQVQCIKNLEPDPRYKALLRKLKLPV